jgi:hypothetical protein
MERIAVAPFIAVERGAVVPFIARAVACLLSIGRGAVTPFIAPFIAIEGALTGPGAKPGLNSYLEASTPRIEQQHKFISP